MELNSETGKQGAGHSGLRLRADDAIIQASARAAGSLRRAAARNARLPGFALRPGVTAYAVSGILRFVRADWSVPAAWPLLWPWPSGLQRRAIGASSAGQRRWQRRDWLICQLQADLRALSSSYPPVRHKTVCLGIKLFTWPCCASSCHLMIIHSPALLDGPEQVPASRHQPVASTQAHPFYTLGTACGPAHTRTQLCIANQVGATAFSH